MRQASLILGFACLAVLFAGCAQQSDPDLVVNVHNSTSSSISVHLRATHDGVQALNATVGVVAGGQTTVGYLSGPRGDYILTATVGNRTHTDTWSLDGSKPGWLTTVYPDRIEFSLAVL